MNTLGQIAEILTTYSLHDETLNPETTPLMKKIEAKMNRHEELVFILPAFPAKSPSPEKTGGELPDFGEVLALKNLQSICDRISELYNAGARMVICSDGRVFSDVVKVSDESIDRYNDGIRSIINEYNLSSISIFTMEDIFPDRTPSQLREILLDFYALTTEEVRNLVCVNENYRDLFNGVHRFLLEDEVALNTGSSKSAMTRETKKRAYELIRRSDAWSALLNEHFRDALRLSIHPHPPGHEKFGIKLVPGSTKWATPWHNVVVKVKNNFELMHKREALKLNAILKMERDKYAYFEVPAV